MLFLMYFWTFILGINASLLGALWPVMYLDFDVALSSVGIFSWINSGVSLVASLCAGALLKKIGAGRLTAICGCMVALALLGYSLCGHFWLLCLLSIPYGIAVGIICVSANNYVAMHYHSRHMSWIHCLWGVGTIFGPNMAAYLLRTGRSWNNSYFLAFVVWAVWSVAIILSLKKWKSDPAPEGKSEKSASVPLLSLIKVKGVKEAMLTFFLYNSLEQGMMLWTSSYMVLYSGLTEDAAATYASLYFIGITAGRMLSGFLTARFSDDNLIKIGEGFIAVGVVLMMLPVASVVNLIGLVLIGVGCAPVCPCLLHSTPAHFGHEHSQALVGIQVAASTLGNCLLPSLFGLVANHISIALLPVYVLICLVVMAIAHHRLSKNVPT